MMVKKTLIFLSILIFFSHCKKDENEDVFIINIKSTQPVSLQEFQENVMVTISYIHPNGYVGFFDPDYLSLEVKDSRLTNPDYYHLIPVTPPNQSLSVQGELLIQIDAPFIFGNGLTETLTYDIRIQDINKQWSNKVTTSEITVNR
tara:strand:- start:561 stop:998 length:438 start_codon:yes stop_codon:yes gene_type:complete